MNWIDFQRASYELTEREISILTKDIISNYRQLNNEISELIKVQYLKYYDAKNTANFYNELIKYNRLVNLKAEISTIYLNHIKTNNKTITDILTTGFSELYNRKMFAANWLIPDLVIKEIPKDLIALTVKGTVDSWKKITQSMINRYGNLSLYQPMTGTLSALLKDNAQKGLRSILSTLSSNIVANNPYMTTAQALRQAIGTTVNIGGKTAYSGGLYNALRIVRTESNRVMGDASYAQAQSLQADGQDVWKIWIATLDTRTRDTHAELDGVKIRPDEEFVASDGDRALSPGNFSRPENVINCRCSLGEVIGDYSPEIRRGRDPVTGENEVFSYKNYEEWAIEKGLKKEAV